MPHYLVTYTGQRDWEIEAANPTEAELAAGELMRDEWDLAAFDVEEVENE